MKGIYELWGHGTTYEELEKSVKEYPDERKLPFLTPDSTFKIIVDSFGKVISSQEQNDIMKSLTYIPFKVADMFDAFILMLIFLMVSATNHLTISFRFFSGPC